MTTKSKPSILIISTKADLATDAVILRLSEKDKSFFRINTEDLPLHAEATYSVSRQDSDKLTWHCFHGGEVSLSDVAAVWYRRHRLPAMPDLIPAHQEYCLRETDWFIRGALYAMDAAWMSHPVSVQQSESKIFQLNVAQRLGFLCPDTIVTNDAEQVKVFYRAHEGRIIAKPLRMGYFDYGDRQTCVFTEVVTSDDLADGAGMHMAPVIYQQLLEKAADIRVTIVGEQAFAAEIDSQSIKSARVDWRKSDTDQLGHSRHILPAKVQLLCKHLMTTLNLQFGAIDLVLGKDGNYYFLEINPNGQWLWIEDRLDFPISSAIAEWLISQSSGSRS